MRPPKLFRSKHYVGVIGLYRSGKSVMITSFINHMRYHHPRYLKLGNGNVRIIFDAELPTLNGFDAFPYDEFRTNGSIGQWPKKSKSSYQYRCSFFRSDWAWTKGELALIDIPGERLPDIPMSKQSYAEWSDWLLDVVFQDAHYLQSAEGYLATVNNEHVTENEVVLAYRKLLGELYRSYRPVITPSSFLLQSDGKFNGPQIFRGDIANAVSGLSNDRQFAPLPKHVRLQCKEMTCSFSTRYKEYRHTVSIPLTKTLSQCNALAILIDVTTLLAANTGMYNGNQALLEKLFEILAPGKGVFGVGMDLLRKGFGGHKKQNGISKIAVIATKADKVHEGQRDKLANLAKDMVGNIVNRFVMRAVQLNCKFIACSAVKSTRSQANGTLLGQLACGQAEYSASELPEEWPGEWEEGQFVFPDVAPTFPRNKSLPPDHLSMDDVIDFLLSPKS